jgi:hypothetical protein
MSNADARDRMLRVSESVGMPGTQALYPYRYGSERKRYRREGTVGAGQAAGYQR